MLTPFLQRVRSLLGAGAHAAQRPFLSRLMASLPGTCALCAGSGPHVVCDGCRAQYLGSAGPRCRCCALPLPSSLASPLLCGACLRRRPAFDATLVAVDYAAPVDQMVLALKFGGQLALAPLFAELLRDAIAGRADGDMVLPDLLTAVPLGPLRLRERGFNQALEIARPLSAALGVPLAPCLLIRARETAAQARLSPLERRHNLRAAFTLAAHLADQVRDRHVAVVDDVMTTGATLNEVAAMLKRFGAARVTNLVFARTLPARD